MLKKPNIIFVMLDTLRADYLDIYGGWVKTKAIRELAANGTLYENAISDGTYTLTSHASLFTGNRVRSMKQFLEDPMKKDPNVNYFAVKYLDDKTPTLAKVLSYLGYSSSLFSNNALVSRVTGLAGGFSYVHEFKLHEEKQTIRQAVVRALAGSKIRDLLVSSTANLPLPKPIVDMLVKAYIKELGGAQFLAHSKRLDTGARETNIAIRKYFDGANPNNNFLFINYIEAHEGYPTEKGVEQNRWLYLTDETDLRQIDALKKGYEQRIKYIDAKVGELLKSLKERGILDDAVVIIGSDHGQAFLEHDLMYHGMFPYNDVSRVPLVIARFVGGKQVRRTKVVKDTVAISALYNHIIGIASGKLAPDAEVKCARFVFSDHTGTDIFNPNDVSQIKALKYKSDYLNRLFEIKKHHNTFATAVYYKNLKLIHFFGNGMDDVMFDVEKDKHEKHNIISHHKEIARMMARAAKE
ncbi:MAG: sulfatase-like hydrolase/transferase [Candidatus Micrarchaeota archaeon]|nr:sulfatase-like hydrolase/transferase [Candidatus Micrarchaeota archaeon]